MDSVRTKLARMLKELAPFGPLWDEEALTARCRSTKMRPLELGNVLFATKAMDGRHRSLGLDVIEPVVILPTGAKEEEVSACVHLRPLSIRGYPTLPGGPAGCVFFRGDFTVTREDQLTPECLDYIVDILCDRMGMTRAAIMNYLFPNSHVADRERFPLVIRIQGWKKLPVVPTLHRNEERAYSSLELISVDRERHFHILNFEAETEVLSGVYLARYNVLQTMMSIVDLHPIVPVWQRTPAWFIARYHELYRGCQGSRWGRLLGLPDKGTRHKDAPEPGEFVIGTPTNLPRHLRPLSDQDVASPFGSHVEWIILYFHCLHRHVIDIPSWLDFAESTIRTRRAKPSVARRDEYEGVVSAGQRYAVDVRHLVRCRNKTYPAPGEPVDDEPMDENEGRDIYSSSSDSSSSSSDSESDSEPEGRHRNIFAGDFDDGPAPLGDDFHPDPRISIDRDTNWREPPAPASTRHRAPIQPRFDLVDLQRLDALTRRMLCRPSLDTRLQWRCPGCNECVDVMDLSETQRQLLAPDMYYGSKGRFIVRNERRDEAVRHIWKVHGSRHLKERGVHLDASHPSNQPSRGSVRRLPRPITPDNGDARRPDIREGSQGDIAMEDVDRDDALARNTQRPLTLTSNNFDGFEQNHREQSPVPPSPSLHEDDSDEDENPFAVENVENEKMPSWDWSCPFRPCGETFQQEALLIAHLSLDHGHEISLKCTVLGCKAYVRTEQELTFHLRTHEESYDPGDGPLTGSRSAPTSRRGGTRRAPVSASSGSGRSFQCPVKGCGKTYTKTWSRGRHISKDHPDITTYECERRLPNSLKKCSAIFFTKKAYREHIMQDHGNDSGPE